MRHNFVFNSPFEMNDRRKITTTLSQQIQQGLKRVSLRFEPKREEKGNRLAEELRRILKVQPDVELSVRCSNVVEGYEMTLEIENVEDDKPDPAPKFWEHPILWWDAWYANKRHEYERRIYGTMLRDAATEALEKLDPLQRQAFRKVGSQVHVIVHQYQRLYEQLRADRNYVANAISLEADTKPTAQLELAFHLDPTTVMAGQALIELEIEHIHTVATTGVPTVMSGSVRITSVQINGKEVALDKPVDFPLPVTISRNTWQAGSLTVDGKPIALNFLPRHDRPLELVVNGNDIQHSCAERFPVLFTKERKVLDGKRLKPGDTCLILSGEDVFLVMEVG